jgi:predicted GTPase
MGPVLPAMGYRPQQVDDLARTIAATPCDLVLAATPIDLGRLVRTPQPVLRVGYAVRELEGTPLADAFAAVLATLPATAAP